MTSASASDGSRCRCSARAISVDCGASSQNPTKGAADHPLETLADYCLGCYTNLSLPTRIDLITRYVSEYRDPRYFSAANIKNRLESYFQMLEQKRPGAAS